MSQNKSLSSLTESYLRIEGSDPNERGLLSPVLCNFLLTLDIIWLVISFYLHRCLYRSTTRIDFRNKISMIFNLLTCYSKVAPFTICYGFIYGNILLPYNYPNSETLGEWFCYVNQYICHAGIMYLGAFTLFTAAMKYWFIVHNVSAKRFGEERVKHIVLNLHLAVPITIGALHVLSVGNADPVSGLNRCWRVETSPSSNHSTASLGTESSTDIFCHNRQYQVAHYFGDKAALVVTPILRTICVGVNGFYILTTCNMIELIFYFLLLRCLDRLFDTSEKSATNDLNAASKTKRKRRHDIRKILLVLAYLIDCSAGVSFFCITTVGNKSMLQERILAAIGFFTYSIPVPLAHLLSEVRVRDTIIENGWYLGLKSIFQTSNAIRNENIEFQRLRIRTSAKRSTRSKTTPNAVQDKYIIDALSERNTCVDYDRDLERQNLTKDESHTQCEHQDSSAVSQEIPEYSKDDSFAPIVHWQPDSNENTNTNYNDDLIRYIDDSDDGLSAGEQLTFYNEEVITPLEEFEKQLHGSFSSSSSLKHSASNPNDQSIDTDTINRSNIAPNNSEKNDYRVVTLHSGICDDILKIERAFPEHSAEVIKIIADEHFTKFSRNFILRRTLKLLCDGATDTSYRKHFVFICVLGGYPMMRGDTISFHDFIIPLINAWYHTSKVDINEGHENGILFEENTDECNNKGFNKIQNERKRIIQLMLIDKNNEQQYNKHLKELYDFEQNQEDVNADGW